MITLHSLTKDYFKASYFDSFAAMGRWRVMDAGDIDGDSDVDLISGAFVLNSSGVPSEMVKDWRIIADISFPGKHDN